MHTFCNWETKWKKKGKWSPPQWKRTKTTINENQLEFVCRFFFLWKYVHMANTSKMFLIHARTFTQTYRRKRIDRQKCISKWKMFTIFLFCQTKCRFSTQIILNVDRNEFSMTSYLIKTLKDIIDIDCFAGSWKEQV